MHEKITFTYRAIADGQVLYEGPSLSSAARAWDSATYTGPAPEGGVSVQSFNADGVMLRDGWIMHVRSNGAVYLSPSIIG